MHNDIEEYWIQTDQYKMECVLAYSNFEASVIFLQKMTGMSFNNQ
jgi:hypothetical protein